MGVGGGRWFLEPLGGEGTVGADAERGEVSPVFHEERGGDDRAGDGERGRTGGERGVPEGACGWLNYGRRRGRRAVVGEVERAVGGGGEVGAVGVGGGGGREIFDFGFLILDRGTEGESGDEQQQGEWEDFHAENGGG